jgi:hypothetical protein
VGLTKGDNRVEAGICRKGVFPGVLAFGLGVLALSRAAAMPGEGGAVEIDNGLVKAQFVPTAEGRVAQEYYARSAGGWQRVAVSFHAPQPFPAEGNRLWDVSVDARRWLVNDALQSVAIEKAKDGQSTRVRLRGAVRDAAIEQVVTLRGGERSFHIAVTAHIPGEPVQLDYLFSTFAFEVEGRPVGGYRNAAPFMVDNLSNSEFWNNVRDAVGMFEWGRRQGDMQLADMARRTINLVLLAPQNERGMFPLNYRAVSGKWVRNMFSASSGQNSHLFTHIDQEGDTYNIVAMSKTMTHLLQYYQRCEPDARILPYARRYADGLLALVDDAGAVPSYVSPEGRPYAPLARSAQGATSMAFLAELFMLTEEPRYRDAARRIGEFLEAEVLPRQAWTDLEQHYSCGNKPLSFTGDTEQGQPARGNLSPLWAADGFAALYRATGDRRHLDAGERCLDYATFSQCCWEPHFIYTAFPFGGFTVDNADTATFLDARQAGAVAPLAWYGRTLGRQDLLERAVAAARSSVVLIRHPRHEGANNIYRHPNVYPEGLGPENIDHEGHPQSAMRTSPSWGEGSGVFTGLAEATWQLGGAYVDVSRNLAVGVDGVRIDEATLTGRTLQLTVVSMLAKLLQPWDQPYRTELRVVGLEPGDYEVVLNGPPAIKATAAELAHVQIVVSPDGRIQPAHTKPLAR